MNVNYAAPQNCSTKGSQVTGLCGSVIYNFGSLVMLKAERKVYLIKDLRGYRFDKIPI